MKPAVVIACVALLCEFACKDIPQAPIEIAPTPPPYTQRILIDSQFYADYTGAILYPSLVVSGSTSFGLTYRLWEAGKYRFAGCPVGCEERRNWFVGDPDPVPGDNGSYAASAAVDDRMQTAYQVWPGAAPPVLKYASCTALCQNSSGWSVTNVDTNKVTGFFVSLATRFGKTHIAYVTALQLGVADTTVGLRYAVCSGDCTSMNAWTKTAVDTAGYGETQIAIDPAGVVHIVYRRFTDDTLRYARCVAGCTTTANWQFSTIGAGGYPSLGVDANANLTLAYLDAVGNEVRIATCNASCVSGVWTEGLGATAESWVYDVALTVAPSGKLYLAYGTTTPLDTTEYGMVRLGGCAAACSVASSWHFITVDSTRWYFPAAIAVALDSVGHAAIAHADSYGMYFTMVKELP